MKRLQSKPEALSEHLKGLWPTDGCIGRPQRTFERSPLRAERRKRKNDNEDREQERERGKGWEVGGRSQSQLSEIIRRPT